jgi:hypothetical protein
MCWLDSVAGERPGQVRATGQVAMWPGMGHSPPQPMLRDWPPIPWRLVRFWRLYRTGQYLGCKWSGRMSRTLWNFRIVTTESSVLGSAVSRVVG